ncbi:histone-lysine N-methyltransferase SETMAR [Ditylenchus destructor]|uniref:Histone-lysine N-methyltransferase SETMAR n=1 Tax=Ditylenchus destructor TaxID=166010 RepID=A0AAD4ML34_9BILA|nr:histone-lysine N-methyltransferase SETMAR [Ditylenchus destructor]
MEKNRGVIRELLKYEYELGHNAKQAMDNINRAKGAGTVAYSTAKEWYSKFRSGNLTIEDNPRSGREVDREAVVNALLTSPWMYLENNTLLVIGSSPTSIGTIFLFRRIRGKSAKNATRYALTNAIVMTPLAAVCVVENRNET